MKGESILGIKVSDTTIAKICDDAVDAVKKNNKMFIASINPEIIMNSIEDAEMKKILNSATHNLPDGVGVIFASKMLHGKIRKRIAGIECAESLCETASKSNLKVFLYGAKSGVAEKAKRNLEKKYHDLSIVGTINGYEKDNKKIIDAINASEANIVLVALGAGKQETWIYNNLEKVHAQVFQCVGGSFDVFSGNSKRAPKVMQEMGIEWLFRLIREPWRFKRQIKIVKFVTSVMKERFSAPSGN